MQNITQLKIITQADAIRKAALYGGSECQILAAMMKICHILAGDGD